MGLKQSKYFYESDFIFEPEDGYELCLKCKNHICISSNYHKPIECYNKILSDDDISDALDMLAFGKPAKQIMKMFGLKNYHSLRKYLMAYGEKPFKGKSAIVNKNWAASRRKKILSDI